MRWSYQRRNINMENKSSISFSSLLTVAFIVLKLCGIINWGWIWVISPLWIGALIAIVLVIIAALLP